MSNDGGSEGLKIDNSGDVHFYDNVAAPIDGWLYGGNKTIQTISPADIEQADQSAVLPIANYSWGDGVTQDGESNFAIYRHGYYTCVYPYGYFPTRVYFNFAGDPPAEGFEVWASSVSSNVEAYKLVDISNPSNTGWYDFTYNTTLVGAGWYIFIKFRQSSTTTNWNIAGGMIEFTRNTNVDW